MASPMPIAPVGSGSWNGQHAQHQQLPPQQRSRHRNQMPPQAEADESGVQVRPVGLKVHYTFDKDSKVNCLARYPQTLYVQTVPIDETNLIGIIDLRSCIHAVMECSPELAGQETDYTIYAVDFSEPDTPLVGQGLLSWALNSMRNDSMMQQPKMVTGRVTKNVLGVFGGGNRETLEVRLRLAVAARPNSHMRHDTTDMQQNRPMESAMTPTGTSEWNSCIQSNPHTGQSQTQMSNASRVASPALSQGHGPHSSMMGRRDSFGPVHHQQQMAAAAAAQELQRIAPMPMDTSEQRTDGAAAASSRPSSRASNRAPRRKQPTGRPRGRPRKKAMEGNTSGYEDGTEGEDAGPAKKRAKTTVVERASPKPFASDPESLRVAASTSGSLRNFRPVLANIDPTSGNNSHLQEVPRAPTPVPEGPQRGLQGREPGSASMLRQESTLSQQPAPYNSSSFAGFRQSMSPSQEDGRSPDSRAPTPTYSDGSLADIGSSPPVQRTTPFIRSSPPPSSPVLPPMPSGEETLLRDTRFAAIDDLDKLLGDEQPLQVAPNPIHHPRAVRARKPTEARNASGVPIKVFQMQAGLSGQDLVHICSYNTPQPNSTLSQAPADSQSLPPLEKPPVRMAAKNKKRKPASPPAMAPTPPPTTDAVENEKPVNPILTVEEAGVEDEMEKGTEDTTEDTTENVTENTTENVTENTTENVTVNTTENVTVNTTENMASEHIPVIAPETTIEPSPPAGVEESSEEQGQRGFEPPPPAAPPPVAPPATSKASRQLGRSQSAGPLALPAVPASEPAGPSSLSQSMAAKSSCAAPPALSTLQRAASTGPLTLPIPASDPVVSIASASDEALLESLVARSDAIRPPSSPPTMTRSNKNHVKKHAIKQRLEAAIMNGEMPPYCSNCGAIETPTWRKIWVQEKEGVPEYCEYSVEPGKVTAIEILQRDADEKPTLHRLIKKNIGEDDDRIKWQELLLCNPCGIWLTKCKSHRPQDRWDRDASRLGQERKKRNSGRSTSRPKRSRAKSDGLLNPTSDAFLHTDALAPMEPSSPKQQEGEVASETQQGQDMGHREDASASLDAQSNPGSTRSGASRGSGTVMSPIDVEFDDAVGSTKRLLFPSPRKEGVLKTLGELDVNVVQTPDDCRPKGTSDGKENLATTSTDNQYAKDDDIDALFESPTVARPCTPPPNANAETPKQPFKTPTRPGSSHRPITRSISRSIRSVRSVASPGQKIMVLRTPTMTPRATFGFPGSTGRRRSPRNHQGEFELFDTPISRTISQMFSDGTGYGENELDLSNLPCLDGNGGGLIDFGNLLSTDAIMPSSPPKDGSTSFDYHATASVWASWDLDANCADTS